MKERAARTEVFVRHYHFAIRGVDGLACTLEWGRVPKVIAQYNEQYGNSGRTINDHQTPVNKPSIVQHLVMSFLHVVYSGLHRL
jgi:hypothetical protein